MSESAAAVLTRAIDWQKRHGACAMLIAESAIGDDGLSDKSHINFSLNTSFRDAKTQSRNP